MPFAALMLALLLSAEPAAPCPAELFRIERSKNANVVLYEAHPGKDTPLDPDEPVTAAWLLLASTGGREKLGFFERTFAYGFKVKKDSGGEGFVLTLKAFKDRDIRIAPRGSCPRATATIDGREAYLTRLFVQADERKPVPKVQWVQLHGVDVETGEPRTEKLVRGAAAQ